MMICFLEDVCEILDSQRVPITAKDRTKGIYPYYGANGIQDYVDDYIFDDELVLLAEDGGNFGSKDRPIAYRVSGKCWVNNHAHVLKAKDCIDVDYLCYSIMFYDVSSMVNGATRKKLNQATMRKMLIPLPSKEKQLEIVANLDKVTQTIDLCNAILEKLDLLVKSRFVEMFGDPIDNPLGWDKLSLEEMCSSIVDLLIAADCTAYAYGNFHHDFIKGRITLIGCPKLDAVDYAEKLTEIFRNNDIKSITLTRMTVPCCGGMEYAIKRAIEASGKDIPLEIAVISPDSSIVEIRK